MLIIVLIKIHIILAQYYSILIVIGYYTSILNALDRGKIPNILFL